MNHVTEGESRHSVASLAEAILERKHDPTLAIPLPLSLLEIIDRFIISLSDPNESNETRMQVLKALRSGEIAKDQKYHSRLINAALPLLLDPSVPIRIHSGSLLSPVISTATHSLVVSQFPMILTTVSQSLSPLQNMITPSGSLRFISLGLRLLNASLLKLGPFPSLTTDQLDSLINLISSWIYFTRSGLPKGATSPSAPRDRIGSSSNSNSSTLSFGVLNAFLPSTPVKSKKTHRSLSNSSSRSSLSTIVGIGYGSESEDETNSTSTSKNHEIQSTLSTRIRSDSLTLLTTLCSTESNSSLYRHWNRFLSDSIWINPTEPNLIGLVENDENLEIKLKALAAVRGLLIGSKAYLSIAEDRPTKASFTSLSAKLGSLLTQLHLKVSNLITSPLAQNYEELLLGLLKLAEVLGKNSSYARLRRRALAKGLVESILGVFDRVKESTLISSSLSALSSIVESELSGASDSTPTTLPLSSIIDRLSPLLDHPEHKVPSWSLLSIIAPQISFENLREPIEKLLVTFLHESEKPLSSQIDFYKSLFIFNPTLGPFPLESKEIVLPLVNIGCTTPRIDVRIATSSILASRKLSILVLETKFDPIEELLSFLQPGTTLLIFSIKESIPVLDSSIEVKNELEHLLSTTIRSLGLLITQPHINPTFIQFKAILQSLLFYSRRRTNESHSRAANELLHSGITEFEKMRELSSWSFANVFLVLPLELVDQEVVQACLELTSRDQLEGEGEREDHEDGVGERIRVNGIRASGILFARFTKVISNKLSSETHDESNFCENFYPNTPIDSMIKTIFTSSTLEFFTIILIDSLQDHGLTPKTRWSSATSIGSLLTLPILPLVLRNDLLKSLNGVLFEGLAHVLEESFGMRPQDNEFVGVQQLGQVDKGMNNEGDDLEMLRKKTKRKPNYKILIQVTKSLRLGLRTFKINSESVERSKELETFLVDKKEGLLLELENVRGKERSHAEVLKLELEGYLVDLGID